MIKRAFVNTLYLSLFMAVMTAFGFISANAIVTDTYVGQGELWPARTIASVSLGAAFFPFVVFGVHLTKLTPNNRDQWYSSWRSDALFYTGAAFTIFLIVMLGYLWPVLREFRRFR